MHDGAGLRGGAGLTGRVSGPAGRTRGPLLLGPKLRASADGGATAGSPDREQPLLTKGRAAAAGSATASLSMQHGAPPLHGCQSMTERRGTGRRGLLSAAACGVLGAKVPHRTAAGEGLRGIGSGRTKLCAVASRVVKRVNAKWGAAT